ncbi:hypothetical protein GCM10010279_64850 [Streptomyces mutabilis]|nr:hypothetical protein GCM10010279_64850 [Streptomyces mutabilis]
MLVVAGGCVDGGVDGRVDAHGRRDERCREYRRTFVHPARRVAGDRSGDDERDGRDWPRCPLGADGSAGVGMCRLSPLCAPYDRRRSATRAGSVTARRARPTPVAAKEAYSSGGA